MRKSGRLVSEDEFFQQVSDRQRENRLKQITGLIPQVAIQGLRPEQTNLDETAISATSRRPSMFDNARTRESVLGSKSKVG